MEKKSLLMICALALLAIAVLLGPSITGFAVHKTEYDELCAADSDCFAQRCCMMYEDKSIGLCMDDCRSVDFLCESDAECEEGTVCCLSDGRGYGLCNNPDKCQSVDIFARYASKIDDAEKAGPVIEYPASITLGKYFFLEAAIILALFGFILWRFLADKKKKK